MLSLKRSLIDCARLIASHQHTPCPYQFISTMSTSNKCLKVNSLQQTTQQALYRAGRLKLDEQFEPWSDYLQKAMETAALYGLTINAAEAEAAIECLFEINPQAC